MGRRSNKIWAVKMCSFFASVAFMAITRGGVNAQINEDFNTENHDRGGPAGPGNQPNNCEGKSNGAQSRFLMLVSTLDGKISALNVAKEGSVEWSFNTGSGPMLSSSISKLELTRNGKKIHLIPSLDGGLYQYNGQSVEPVPFNADTLLSSSFRLSDNSIVVGGKETETYGVNVNTGKVKYMCDMKGCKLFTKEDEHTIQESDDTLVISRNTKTVRAVELTSGNEIWNFSVGQHEVAHILAESSKLTTQAGITDESKVTVPMETTQDEEDDEDITIQSCADDAEDESFFSFPWWGDGGDLDDTDLKVIVPKGLVIATSRSIPGKVYWQHKFNTAIANAWILQEGKLKEVDLFDASNVPALAMETETSSTPEVEYHELPDTPALYIGIHEKQCYVQPSVQMMHLVEDHINSAIYKGQIYPVDMPRVAWKPYMATASSRTPIEVQKPLQLTWEEGLPDQSCDNSPEALDTGANDAITSPAPEGEDSGVTVWAEYPYDLGYYLFPDFTPMQLNPVSGKYSVIDNGSSPDDFYFDDYVTDTLWRWWKEVLAISIFTSVILNVLIVKFFFPKPQSSLLLEKSSSSLNASGTETTEGATTQIGNAESPGRTESESEKSVDEEKPEYHSRYYSDFEQISCLGRGGFGVVYHTRNQLDDCDYAVKRITLNNSEKAREKVMREVKALAKLDHSGIVRYYQAWLEIPPPGWQEERDKVELADVTFSPTPGYIVTEFTPSPKPTNEAEHSPTSQSNRGRQRSRVFKKNVKSVCPDSFNPLKPFAEPNISEVEEGEQSLVDDNTNDGILFGATTGEEEITESQGQVNLQRGGSTEPFLPGLSLDFEDMSGSFNFGAGTRENISYSNGDSFDISFGRDNLDSNNQRSSSTPFRVYQKDYGKNSIRDDLHGNSVDIIFEDSGCSEKSHDDTNGIDHGHAVIDVSFQSSSVVETASSNTDTASNHVNTDKKRAVTRPNSLDLDGGENEGVENATKNEETRLIRRSATPPLQKLYLYIQMQLCRKESLKEWLASNTLSRDRQQCLDIFDQIVGAVDYVHGSGLMHRDLKPSNIFFSLDGTIKVGDFGLVTALEECGDLEAIDVVRTPASVYYKKHTDQVGTKLYMSPEQIGGRKYTHKVDIYALGLIFFELFYPFATQMERVRTLLEVKRLLMPKRFLRELPEECTFVKELLSPVAEQRPSTKDILNHSLLKYFQDARLMVSRIRSNSRSRTVSQSSKDSNPGANGASLSESP